MLWGTATTAGNVVTAVSNTRTTWIAGVRSAVLPELSQTANVTTMGAASTTLMTITPTDNKVSLIQVNVVGRKSTGNKGISWTNIYNLRKLAGTITQIAGASPTATTQTDDAGYTVAFAISGANLLVNVTGVAGETVDWYASAKTTEIGIQPASFLWYPSYPDSVMIFGTYGSSMAARKRFNSLYAPAVPISNNLAGSAP
jgi:hypothetical protein